MRTSKFRVLHYADDYGPQRWEYLTLPEDIMGESWKDKTAYNWETWGQWTGLIDRHGIEIYGDDILLVYGERRVVEFRTAWWGVISPEEYWKEYGDETTWAMPAGFGTEQADSDQFKPLYRYDLPEVIGNIHENPELLRGEQ